MEINLDNTAFSMLSCDYKFQQAVIRGIKPPVGPEAAFGSVVHRILELKDNNIKGPELVAKVHSEQTGNIDLPKALTLTTFMEAAVRLPPPITLLDNRPATELKFRHKYASFILPGSQELLDIYLLGTIDRIYLDNETLVITDYKTTAAGSNYSIDGILSSYSLAFQLPFYLYALRFFSLLPKVYEELLAARQYKMEIILICHNTNPPSFRKYIRPAFNDDFLTREIPLIINAKINNALALASLLTQAPRTGFTVYKACDNCAFRPVCLHAGTAKEQEILSSFPVIPYNPMTFR